MNRKPENTDKLKERVCPGIWIDMNNDVHFSVAELLKLFGLPDNEKNRAKIREMCESIVREVSGKHGVNAAMIHRSDRHDHPPT